MYARQMEAFAAQLDHVDHEIGRMIAALERTGMLDNTLIMVTSDNGASGEGGLEGSHNEVLFVNGVWRRRRWRRTRSSTTQWGSAETDNHYHAGWAMAGNTPFRYFKQTQPQRRHRRPDDRPLAQGNQGQGRTAHPVSPHHRRRADLPRRRWYPAACRKWTA